MVPQFYETGRERKGGGGFRRYLCQRRRTKHIANMKRPPLIDGAAEVPSEHSASTTHAKV